MKSDPARTFEGCPPESAGRPQEAGGNAGRRWMAVARGSARNPGNRTRRIARLVCLSGFWPAKAWVGGPRLGNCGRRLALVRIDSNRTSRLHRGSVKARKHSVVNASRIGALTVEFASRGDQRDLCGHQDRTDVCGRALRWRQRGLPSTPVLRWPRSDNIRDQRDELG